MCGGALMQLVAYGARGFAPDNRPKYYLDFKDDYNSNKYDEIYKPLEPYNIDFQTTEKYNLPWRFNYCINIDKYVSYRDKEKKLKTEKDIIKIVIKEYNQFIKEYNYDYSINNVNRKLKSVKQLKKRYKNISKKLNNIRCIFHNFKEENNKIINNIKSKCDEQYNIVCSDEYESIIKVAFINYRNNFMQKLKRENLKEYLEFINDLNENENLRKEYYLFQDDEYLYI